MALCFTILFSGIALADPPSDRGKGHTGKGQTQAEQQEQADCEAAGNQWMGSYCYEEGSQIGTTDGECDSGWVWLDLYNMCIPIS
jgi:hypothetical protein